MKIARAVRRTYSDGRVMLCAIVGIFCFSLMIIGVSKFEQEDGGFVAPTHPMIQYIGRYEHGKNMTRFDMSGNEIHLRVEDARKVSMLITRPAPPAPKKKKSADADEEESEPDPGSPTFVVYIDGVLQHAPKRTNCRQRNCTFETNEATNGTMQAYMIAHNLAKGVHDIRVVKASEPSWPLGYPETIMDIDQRTNWIEFNGFELDGGHLIPTISQPRRRIEFIGDSTMTGYCSTCMGPLDPSGIAIGGLFVDWTGDAYWRSQIDDGQSFAAGESHYNSWPSQLCQRVGAQCHTTAWSGLGLTHECCGNTVKGVEDIWKRTVQSDKDSEWDFSWVPDVLIINIGMMDGKQVGTPQWLDHYTALVTFASKKYGKDLNVFLACGPVTSRYCADTRLVVERTRQLGVKSHFLDQRPFLNGTYGGSCCGHPSLQVAEKMAAAAAQTLEKVVGWQGLGQDEDVSGGSWLDYECDGHACTEGLLEQLHTMHKHQPHLLGHRSEL